MLSAQDISLVSNRSLDHTTTSGETIASPLRLVTVDCFGGDARTYLGYCGEATDARGVCLTAAVPSIEVNNGGALLVL